MRFASFAKTLVGATPTETLIPVQSSTVVLISFAITGDLLMEKC
jgi:hypothetical protein